VTATGYLSNERVLFLHPFPLARCCDEAKEFVFQLVSRVRRTSRRRTSSSSSVSEKSSASREVLKSVHGL
jgi:hypothetical protein